MTEYLRTTIEKYTAEILPFFSKEVTCAKDELLVLEKFKMLLEEKGQSCFERTCYPAHITGSSIVLNKSLDKIILTHHKKLNKWLQLGGHSDGDCMPPRVSLREAHEESGISEGDLSLINPISGENSSLEACLPLDFDIHEIPARKSEPKHYHYDVRYLILAKSDRIKISDESNDLQWFAFDDVKEHTEEISTLRQVEKVKEILAQGKILNA